jgi:hypothetical protein
MFAAVHTREAAYRAFGTITQGVQTGNGTDYQGGSGMYQFSRSIYREVAPSVVEDADDLTGCNKQAVLDACEAAIRRLAYDGRYFAHPSRWLFNEIRPYLRMVDQLRAREVVEANMNLAVKFFASCPGGVDLDGRPRHCQAHTREGTPCQRVPLEGRDFCPSHKEFEEFLKAAEAPPATEVAAAA